MSGNERSRDKGRPAGGETSRRLRRLVYYRILGAFFLLLYTLYYDLSGSDILPPAAFRILYCVIGGLFLLSTLYYFLLPFIRSPEFHIRVQCLGDIFLITVLVYGTGGAGSVYTVLYSLVIIYAVLFLGRQGGLLTASMSTIFYGVVLNLEYHGVFLPPAGPGGGWTTRGISFSPGSSSTGFPFSSSPFSRASWWSRKNGPGPCFRKRRTPSGDSISCTGASSSRWKRGS